MEVVGAIDQVGSGTRSKPLQQLVCHLHCSFKLHLSNAL